MTNTGTYIDCPFHRYADGKDVASMPIERFVDVPAICVRTALQDGARAIDAAMLAAACVRTSVAGCAVLIHTDWDRHWGTEQYFEGHPYLTEDAAMWLRLVVPPGLSTDGGVVILTVREPRIRSLTVFRLRDGSFEERQWRLGVEPANARLPTRYPSIALPENARGETIFIRLHTPSSMRATVLSLIHI